MQTNKTMRGIEDINCSEIENEANKLGLNELEFIGKYWHPDHQDTNDWAIEIYQFPGGVLVAKTNGDAVWENQDLQVWAELTEQYGVE